MQTSAQIFPAIDFRTRFPALDGLRGVALIVVFLSHFAFFFVSGRVWHVFILHAHISIDLWFVLSGFLITGILYDTRADTQFFRRFYLRRAIRIFPIFYLVAAILLLLTPVLLLRWRPQQMYYLVYLGNYFTNSHPNLTIVGSARSRTFYIQLVHLWSLCIEEQFYLIWPLIVWKITNRVRLLQVSAALCIADLILRTFLVVRYVGTTEEQLPFMTLHMRLDNLLLGAVLALLLRGSETDRWQRLCPWILSMAASALGVIYTIVPHPARELISNTIGVTLVGIASAALIGCCLPTGGRLTRRLTAPPLRSLGKYSYSFYLIHLLPVFAWYTLNEWLSRKFHHPTLTGFFLVILIFFFNLLMAKLSYDYYEIHFLRLKRHFRYDQEQTLPAL